MPPWTLPLVGPQSIGIRGSSECQHVALFRVSRCWCSLLSLDFFVLGLLLVIVLAEACWMTSSNIIRLGGWSTSRLKCRNAPFQNVGTRGLR